MKIKITKKINFLIIAVSIFALAFPFYNKKTNTAEAANFLDDATPGWQLVSTINGIDDSPRIGHSSVYSNYGGKNEMIIFGGLGTRHYNDVWILDLNSNTWRLVNATANEPPEPPDSEPCFDEKGSLVKPCPPADLPSTGPAKRLSHAAAYDSESDTMYIFGGWQLNGPVFRDFWALTNVHTNPIWVKKTPAPTPFSYGLRNSSAVWNPSLKKMIVFGGVRDDARIYGRTMIFDPTTGWTHFDGGPSRYGHSAVWTGSEMIIFGGRKQGAGQKSYLNDTWKSTDGTSWSNISTTNDPIARQGAKAFYDTLSKQMMIFGGDIKGDGYDNRSFVLNIQNGAWKERTFSNLPTARHDYGAIYNEKDEIWVYGGRESNGTKKSDIHKLKFSTPPAAPTLNSITSSCVGNSNPDNFIKWNDNSDNEDYFDIYRSIQPFATSPINPTEGTLVLSDFSNTGSIKSPPEQISTDTTPAQDTTYRYRVLAQNNNDTMWALSNEVSIPTKNCGPTANSQSPSTPEDTPLSITLSGSDYDGKALVYTITSTPAHGSLTGDAPNLTYAPSLNYHGADSFTFTVTDNALGVSALATVSITINSVNDPPTLTPIGDKTISENSPLSFKISGSDVEGDSLTYSASGLPTGASFNTDTFSWTPTYEQGNSKPTYYTGVVFSVSDGVNTTNETIQITVNNTNRPPTANAQSVSVTKNTPKDILLVATDPDGDALTYTPSVPPKGTLKATPADDDGPTYTYKPETDYVGLQGDFTFSVNDGAVDSNHATVDITVSDVAPGSFSISSVSPSCSGTDSRNTITWSASPGATSYTVYYCTGSGCTPSTSLGAQTSPFVHSALTYNTIYRYKVTATNAIGNTDSDVLGTTSSDCTPAESPPTAPSNLTGLPSCEGSNDAKITLNWTDNATNETVFKLHRGAASDFTPSNDNKIADIAANTTTYLDTTPSPSTTYYYKINAINTAGGSNYATSPIITTNSCAPTFVLDPANASISIGATQQFNGYYDADGPGGASPNTSISGASISSWNSSNTNIASINTSGLASGVSAGTVTISGTYSGLTATANLTVTDASKPNASISIKALDNITDIDKSLIGEVFYANVKNSTAPEGKSLSNVSFCFDNTPSNDTCDGDIWNEYLWGQTNGSWDAGPAKSLTLTGILTRLGTWAVYVKVKDSSDVWSDIAKDTVQIAPLLGGIPNCPADYTARADLSWIKPNQAENDSTGIQILRTTGGADGTYTQIGHDLINTAISYQDTDVSVSTSYHYKIRYLRAGDDTDSNKINITTGSCAPQPPPSISIGIAPLRTTKNPTEPMHFTVGLAPSNGFRYTVEVYIKSITSPNGGNINDLTGGLTKDLVSYSNPIEITPKNGIYDNIYFGIKGNNENSRGYLFNITLAVRHKFGADLDSEFVYFYVNQRPNAYFYPTTPVSGNSPITVNFKDGKPDGTPSDGGKDGDNIWWADGKDIVLHLGNLNGNKTADGDEMWDHCYSTTLSIDCKNIVTEELPDGESYRSDSWNFTYTESAQAKYCVFDNLILRPDSNDPKLSMGCATPIDITINPINPKPVAESKNITVEKNSVKNTISLNGIPINESFVYKITNLPTNGKLYNQNTEELTACSEDSPCVLNNLSPLTSINTFYTPNTEYIGSDKFTFKVNNGEQDSDNGTTSITVVNNETNQAPVAEASFTLGGGRNCDPNNGQSGNVCSYTNPLIVNQGEAVNIVSFNADIDTNGDGKASYDPNGWTDADFGVSNSGKCEWDKDFSGAYDSPAIKNPSSPAGCNINSSFDITFNNSFNNDEIELLKITDNKGLTGVSKVKVIVKPAVIPNEAPVSEASFLVNGERYSYKRPLIVDVGNPVTITSFDAHKDVNGDGKASYDPNGWTDADFGVSNGGKCEWDKDFNGAYEELISNPSEPINCSISGSFSVTFNTPSTDQILGDPFTILKITDKGSLFGDSAVRLLVKGGGGNKPNLIISAGPTVNSGDLTEDSLITFKGTVNNNGNENATNNFLNEFGIDVGNDGSVDVRLPKININKLNAGDTREIISGNWRAIRGTHRITLCADSDNSINESNEADNCSPGNIGIIIIDPPCADECFPDGSETCVTDNSFKTCGRNFDADDCLELSAETNCGAGETCVQTGINIKCLLLPIISFSANPTTIKKGETSTLTWNTQNIIPANGDTCTASNSNNYPEWKGDVNPNGDKLVAPAKTTEYTLTCENSLGEVSESVTIRVQSKPPIEI